MAYDEDLADRVRELITAKHEVTEQCMFGGLSFLIDGMWLRVPADDVRTKPQLRAWVDRGAAYAAKLAPKKSKPKKQ